VIDGIFLARPEQEPAAGIRLAVKDLFDTAGLVTTYGSAIFASHVPERTAEAVLRLERAGYAVVGKANLDEFAYGTTSENPHYGTVPNPVAPGRIAGGSSGGSAAALAAGFAAAALGSDSGGSIRIPAACCAVAGFKPTHGLVPLDGCFPLSPSFDHAGPMARTVAGLTRMMQALAPELDAHELESPEELEVGVAWIELADPLVRARVEEAAARFPRRQRIDLPLLGGVWGVFRREVADVHRELFDEYAELYGPNAAAKIEGCLALSDAEYEAARGQLAEYRERSEELLADVDLLVTPTLPCVPPPVPTDELELRETLIRFTSPFNALGRPALALPCGRAEDELPASVQLVGAKGADALVLAAGEFLEAVMASPV